MARMEERILNRGKCNSRNRGKLFVLRIPTTVGAMFRGCIKLASRHLERVAVMSSALPSSVIPAMTYWIDSFRL